jgi:hypothetical protein
MTAIITAIYTHPGTGEKMINSLTLPIGKTIKFGHWYKLSDMCLPDSLMSGHQGSFVWDGKVLKISERTPTPMNRIYYKDVANSEFTVTEDDYFVVGTTLFKIQINNPERQE